MRLLFLGTGGAQPTKTRGLSCICIERNGEIIMFDAGEAAQVAYLKMGLGWNKPMRICITHLHGDHCTGLLGLLQTMSMQNRTKPLEIFGPAGLEEFVLTNIRILNFRPTFTISVSPISPGVIFENGEYEIHASHADHSITAFSYVLQERDKAGRFDVDKAAALGVPRGSLWGNLQNGSAVYTDHGIVYPEQVLGPSKPGKRIGISGDTAPSPELNKFFEGCDYLVFDATFLDRDYQRAIDTRHSTATQAATLAKASGVKNLVLTHFSSRYKDSSRHLTEAQKIHPSVIAAEDLLELTLV